MDNSKIINQINQLLHNQGIKQEERFNVLFELLESNKFDKPNKPNNPKLDNKFNDITELLNSLDYNNKDLIQEIFMQIGSKYTKFNLDQFYTPLTISQFISSMMTTGEAIDPAGGTGDLLLYYNGPKTIWDIDENALKLCKFNYELNKQTNYILSCKNSLDNFVDHVDRYSYSTMNPPFGSNTIVTDKSILDKFELGKGKKKQEIGILFLELGLKLLKHNGILFVIVPAGYLGNSNKNCSELRELILKNRLIASVSLPENTFKRSGTGVNTYLLIIQKKSVSLGSYNVEPYNIYIKDINNIGYNLTKKDTPLKYKIVKETGDYELDNDNKQLLDNDLEKTATELSTFCLDNNIAELSHTNNIMSYESVSTSKLTLNILDVKRYLQTYITILHELTANSAVKVKSLCKIVSTTTKINKTSQYKYIDISEINSPLYSYKDLYGWELPSRAKYTLKKHDILISKLEGTMSYCVILEDDPNYIATNGVCVLRPNNMNCLYILISNIMTKKFVIQHNAFLTGSIMASVSDTDIEEIWIDEKNVDIASTKKILDTLELLQQLRK